MDANIEHKDKTDEKDNCNCCKTATLVLGSFFLHFITMGLVQSFGILYVEILNHFNSNNTDSSWIPSLSTGLMLALGPVVGILEKKIGCRMIAVSGSILVCVGLASSMFVQSVYLLYLTYGIITGIGFGFLHLVSCSVVSIHVTNGKSIALGFGSAGGGVGTMVFPFISNYFLATIGWKWTFLVLSGISLLCVIPGLFFPGITVSKGSDESKSTENESKSKKEDRKNALDIRGSSRKIFIQKGYILFAVSSTLVALVYFIPYIMTPELALQRGIDLNDAAGVITVAGCANIIGKVGMGAILENKNINPLLLNGFALILGGVSTFICVQFNGLVTFIIYGALIGLSNGAFGLMQSVVVLMLVGEDLFSLAFGFSSLFSGISVIVGPPIAGWIVDFSGDYLYAYYYIGFFFICGGLLSCAVWVMRKCEVRKQDNIVPTHVNILKMT